MQAQAIEIFQLPNREHFTISPEWTRDEGMAWDTADGWID
jgi:hypothetical protein